MIVMQVLNGLKFYERLLNLIHIISIVFFKLISVGVARITRSGHVIFLESFTEELNTCVFDIL